jgi:hypothetical protein
MPEAGTALWMVEAQLYNVDRPNGMHGALAAGRSTDNMSEAQS